VRCVFFGTPAIALPTLDALLGISEIVATVCQPDRPGGRGLKQLAPPVRLWAQQRGIQVFQPDSLKDGALSGWVSEHSVDVCVVLAYGKILPKGLLDAPRLGCLNLHASLLPRHRGAAPIQWSILTRDQRTGVTLMRMDPGLDTGPILSQHALALSPRENAETLTQRIATLCGEVARRDIPRFVAGELRETAQPNDSATWAPPIKSEDRRLNFDDTAVAIDARVRAMSPRPGAMTFCRGKILRVLETEPLANESAGDPGTVTISHDRRIIVAARAGSLEIRNAQLEGKKPLSARDLINGRVIASGDHLGA